ncbi:interleukin 21 receptor, tandem duplicate 1 isoform X1 [Micropterus salmoides]|uniref:interleukin 21 receptor, tandem duplicate 1 isoform X1 n=2 Tax=Micropterus salmoides TaxID=27706 RepID=UPI0018EB0ED7|nr:interleukin 21 receptor, tandem duplicate 1 isoform X1 [Micropterus salmoides]XP_038566616.1 interleukin 21 receptor, tandem duplicate 1 isoform X1 [Micropterus salmoides]XP_038566617.1 interleukin 21 receptor, tandem duplicate 1 isoform X1 [Micropterus salmoides]
MNKVPMALKSVLLLLLWDLHLFIYGVTSLCKVTCSTDYSVSLNCSCAGSVPTHPVILEVKCWYSDGQLNVTGSCEVTPLQSWCIMYPEMLEDVASIGTMCTASQQGDHVLMNASESSSWALSDVVKPPPPFDVQVTNTDGFYNITWNYDPPEDCLTYTVRIRESKDLSKEPAYSLLVEQKHILLDPKKLQPRVNYTVDVQGKYCPGFLYAGPWSEWSSTGEWRTTGTSAEIDGSKGFWWCVPILPVVLLVLALLLLGYLQKTYWQKKFQLITYIPRANDFFKPLYHNYGGNFKEWVKPVFSEYDYLKINSHVQMMSEKQHDVLQWDNEKQSCSKDNQMKQGGNFLHMLQSHSNSLLLFQDGGSLQGTGHSTGHISIHTVTLSGEEELEDEVVSQSSVNTLRSYQDGESFGSFEKDNREHAGYDLEEPQMSRMDRQSGRLSHHENQISNGLSVERINFQPRVQLNEPERVSLDSFASNEQSEDGYPHVDLDTMDSGFGECSSPGASDSNIAEQIDSNLFHEHKSSNSNYVKQWMICSTIDEDSSNSENKLHETQ